MIREITPNQIAKAIRDLLDEIELIKQENQQLKEDYSKLLETSKAYKKLLKTTMEKEHQAIKVLDEIREKIEFAKTTIEYDKSYDIGYNFLIDAEKIKEILDKVKE